MNLFILRHGLAVEQTIPSFKLDSDRPLTAEGRKKVRRVAVILSQLKISFDLILTSPYVRAMQTAEIVVEVLGARKALNTSDNLVPGGDAKQLIGELSRRRSSLKDVLLVGHEPDLSRLISILVTGRLGLPIELKKGGLCKLEIGALRYGRCATLQWLLTSKVCAQLF